MIRRLANTQLNIGVVLATLSRQGKVRRKQIVLSFTRRENRIVYRGYMGLSQVEKKPVKVILDSNALFVPFQFKIDIFEGVEQLLERRLELILLSPVKRELETLAKKGSPKMRKNALYALKLAGKCSYVGVDSPVSALVDDIIVEIAKEWKSPVFTNDRQLKKRLRDISVPVIYVRQKSRLEIDGMI